MARGNVKDALGERIEGNKEWYGEIASTPTSQTQRVFVVIPDFSPILRWGPCRWQARDDVSMPAKGDPCLVLFDNRREPWVVAWWPFDT